MPLLGYKQSESHRARSAFVLCNPAKTHGMSRTPTWNSWMSMRKRCGNPRNIAYPKYGGRGITICDRWRTSFENFLADIGERPAGTSIDRIDNDGNYEPGNCRWATPREQWLNHPRERNHRSSKTREGMED